MHVCGIVCARFFSVLREKALGAYDITYVGPYEKSLIHDNDLCYYLYTMKIIFWDSHIMQVINSSQYFVQNKQLFMESYVTTVGVKGPLKITVGLKIDSTNTYCCIN